MINWLEPDEYLEDFRSSVILLIFKLNKEEIKYLFGTCKICD